MKWLKNTQEARNRSINGLKIVCLFVLVFQTGIVQMSLQSKIIQTAIVQTPQVVQMAIVQMSLQSKIAIGSPNGDCPNVLVVQNSPNGNSPNVIGNPNGVIPNVNSPNMNSPLGYGPNRHGSLDCSSFHTCCSHQVCPL